eukprot:6214195-Pleurochrysis_carterae.AAC.12
MLSGLLRSPGHQSLSRFCVLQTPIACDAEHAPAPDLSKPGSLLLTFRAQETRRRNGVAVAYRDMQEMQYFRVQLRIIGTSIHKGQSTRIKCEQLERKIKSKCYGYGVCWNSRAT